MEQTAAGFSVLCRLTFSLGHLEETRIYGFKVSDGRLAFDWGTLSLSSAPSDSKTNAFCQLASLSKVFVVSHS